MGTVSYSASQDTRLTGPTVKRGPHEACKGVGTAEAVIIRQELTVKFLNHVDECQVGLKPVKAVFWHASTA